MARRTDATAQGRDSAPEAAKPKAKTSHTVELSDAQLDALAEWCEQREWAFADVPYSRFSYRGEDVQIVAYSKPTKAGLFKLVVQGKQTESFVSFTLEPEIIGAIALGYEEVTHPEWFEAHAGLDESGKGDLFGPVVTCCVVADGPIVHRWREAGIQDSKKIGSDAAILRLDEIIRGTEGAVVKRLTFSMAKYNELWAKFGRNLNRLMGWMHARCLDQALEERPVPWALLDKFSERDWTGPLLANRAVELRRRTKAESDPIVAAASICARAEYVRRMRSLGDTVGLTLLKGASAAVKQQGREVLAKVGPDRFGDVAKLHFKTAQEILREAGHPTTTAIPREA